MSLSPQQARIVSAIVVMGSPYPFELTASPEFHESKQSLYTQLGRLVEKDYLESEFTAPHRYKYRVTEWGCRALLEYRAEMEKRLADTVT